MREYLYNLATDRYNGFFAAIIKFFLLILSLFYVLVVRILLLFFYRLRIPYTFNCEVISVGNITLGGTGKTTLVEYIARYLKSQGRKVAILSRGYKRTVNSQQSTVNSHQSMGDEPYMLSQKLDGIAVIVDENRFRGGRKAISEYSADTLVLDDGLQQWGIKKDLEIVTIDATNPFGNRHILPRGILREPLSSLKRADVLVLTKTNLNPDTEDIKEFIRTINPRADIMESMHNAAGFYEIGKRELLGVDILKGQTVTLACGIGDPDSFENLIASLGINIGLSFRFPDHHDYTRQEIDNIVKTSKDKGIDAVVITEKDAVKFYELRVTNYELRIFVLCIELKITKDEERFHSRLLRIYPA